MHSSMRKWKLQNSENTLITRYLKKFYKADMKHCAFMYSSSSRMTSLWTGWSGGQIPVGARDVSHEAQWGLHLRD